MKKEESLKKLLSRTRKVDIPCIGCGKTTVKNPRAINRAKCWDCQVKRKKDYYQRYKKSKWKVGV